MIMPPSDLKEDARLSYMLTAWHRWRGNKRWPTRADIDPVDFRQLLPNLFIVEVTPERNRFRFILSGETVRQNLGFELGSRYLEDLFHDDQLARIEASYRSVLDGNAHFVLQHWSRRGKLLMQFRRLLLPLAGENPDRVDLILGFALYDRMDAQDRDPIDHITDPVSVAVISEQAIPLDRPD
jgi:hypothetical protein